MTERTDAHDTIRPPAWWQLALEARAPLEYAATLAWLPLLAASPRGDGHPVLVYPGFVASDLSTRPLRRVLRLLGHDVHGWGQGRNLNPGPAVFDQAIERIGALHRRDGRKVSLVGWSLGGLYSRELAKRVPDQVRCVISLGSPFAGSPRATHAWRLFERLNRSRPRVNIARDSLRAAPPVPTTSIYSRSDGVVAWRCSLQAPSPRSENIEVESSHTGMGVNPLVLHVLADRLAQPEGAWMPFERRGLRRLLYREAASGWQPA